MFQYENVLVYILQKLVSSPDELWYKIGETTGQARVQEQCAPSE